MLSVSVGVPICSLCDEGYSYHIPAKSVGQLAHHIVLLSEVRVLVLPSVITTDLSGANHTTEDAPVPSLSFEACSRSAGVSSPTINDPSEIWNEWLGFCVELPGFV